MDGRQRKACMSEVLSTYMPDVESILSDCSSARRYSSCTGQKLWDHIAAVPAILPQEVDLCS